MSIHQKRLAIGLLVLACALTLALVGATVAFFVTKYAPPAASDGDTPATEDESTPSAEMIPGEIDDGVNLVETPDAGTDYQDRLVFVGDSLTAYLINQGLLSGGTATTQVWRTELGTFNLRSGMSAQKIIFPGPGEHTGRLLTVAAAAAASKPDILIVTLGSDWGAAYLNEEAFKACYTEFIRGIQKASPQTAVILQSIFPVTAGCSVVNNTQINQANQWIHDIAEEIGCRYLNTHSILKDEEGCLKAEYCRSSDGRQLNADAYTAILSYIRTHALTE